VERQSLQQSKLSKGILLPRYHYTHLTADAAYLYISYAADLSRDALN